MIQELSNSSTRLNDSNLKSLKGFCHNLLTLIDFYLVKNGG